MYNINIYMYIHVCVYIRVKTLEPQACGVLLAAPHRCPCRQVEARKLGAPGDSCPRVGRGPEDHINIRIRI